MASTAVCSPYLRWVAAALRGRSGASPLSAAAGHELVLGYATGYDVADVAIFARSLRSHYSGPCALIVDRDPALRDFLKNCGIEALDVPAIGEGGAKWSPHPVVSRFAAFEIILRERHWVRHALLTDVRDVVFQGHPFAEPVETLEFFAETDQPLASHAFNMKYLKAIGGVALADAVTHGDCICVGTVVGQREALMRFCRLNLLLGAIPRSEIGGSFGADQAACNLAVHLGLLEGTVKANFTRVATLGMTGREALGLQGDVIINPDGTRSPVVHQYDRHPDMMEAMWRRWAGDCERRDRVQPRDLRSRLRQLSQSIRKRTPERR